MAGLSVSGVALLPFKSEVSLPSSPAGLVAGWGARGFDGALLGGSGREAAFAAAEAQLKAGLVVGADGAACWDLGSGTAAGGWPICPADPDASAAEAIFCLPTSAW